MAPETPKWIWRLALNVNAVEHLASLIIVNNHQFEEIDQTYLANKVLTIVQDEARELTVPVSFSALQTAQKLATNEVQVAQLLDLYTPVPSAVNRQFWSEYQANGPSAATDYFHHLSVASDYLKVADIARNIQFTEPSIYGELELTINLSKPEKTTAEIAAAKLAPKRDYPQCLLCFQNEGYLGGAGYPERSAHRLIRLTLNNHPWAMQFSPYEYFNEHVIVIDKQHEPMRINHDTFVNLFDFVDLFPHYFLGSNAGLPIIGGSMLAHEHYQGGKHVFPLERAQAAFTFATGESEVRAAVLNWPVTTIRLESTNRNKLVDYADKILQAWLQFDDQDLGIRARDAAVWHHSINPIVRKNGQKYTLYILLRDNNTSAVYPDGIFHVHPEYQHIKQENIGLIEAMGLAILPGRLRTELTEVTNYITGKKSAVKNIHQAWAEELKQAYTAEQDPDTFVQQQIGLVFTHILENTGVFKDISPHNEHLARFINSI